MTTDLVKHGMDPALAILVDRAVEYGKNSLSANTRTGYDADWQDFTTWCGEKQIAALPTDPAALCLYLVDRATTLSVGSLARRLAAIRHRNLSEGHPAPAMTGQLKNTWAGIRRNHGKPPVQKRAVRTEDLVAMTTGEGLAAIRDRALIMVGFAAALRRSELAALTWERDGVVVAALVAEGLEIRLARSKADQEGKGEVVAIPYGMNPALCPVRALKAWIDAAQIAAGTPVWRAINKGGRIVDGEITDKTVARIVKAAAERAGLDPAAYAGHSLRAGLATSAAANNAPAATIMKHMRHARFDTTARYIRDADRFQNNAATYAMARCM